MGAAEKLQEEAFKQIEQKLVKTGKRGRPAKLLKKTPKEKSIRDWQPEWQPEYEKIVADSCLGISNRQLATKYNFTEVHICNILNTEEARVIKKQAIEVIRKKNMETMENLFSEMEMTSVTNMHEILTNEKLKEHHPFAVYDRSVQFLKGIGKLERDSQPGTVTNVQNNTIIISKDEESNLLKGMKEVREIHEQFRGLTGDSVK